MPGLGPDDYPGFSVASPPEEMPDLSNHHSTMAKVFKEDPSIYAELKSITTQMGVPLAKCIKPGMDCLGHPMIQTVGVVAGDAECYETFQPLFDSVIRDLNPGVDLAAEHPSDLDSAGSSDAVTNPSYAKLNVSVSLKVQRNLAGRRLLPACSLAERREVECALVEALGLLAGDGLEGEYFPLVGSGSNPGRPSGMSEEEDRIDDMGLLFAAPDATLMLAAGYGRDWPDGRGVFMSHNKKFAAWINEEDHLCLWSLEEGSDLQAAFRRLCAAETQLRGHLRAAGHEFAASPRLGFITACPSNLGTGLCAEVEVDLQLLPLQQGFRTLCKRLGIQAQCACGYDDRWQLSNAQRLGSSETQQVGDVAKGVSKLLDLEMRLRSGEEIDLGSVAGER
jgi:creatine kinase